MSITAAVRQSNDLPSRALAPFLVLAFGIAWAVLGAYVFFPEAMAARFGQITGSHPMFVLAVYAPAIAAMLVISFGAGRSAVARFLSRLLLWRCPLPWAAFLILGIPAVYASGSALKGNFAVVTWPPDGLAVVVPAMAFMLVLGPVEEIGWRGLALPILQRHLAPFWAAVVLGLIWGLWHLPAFFLSGTPQGAWSLSPFVAGSVAVSVILTPLFNASRGSILLATLFHFQLNNPLWPDAQPHDTLVFLAVAAAVTVVYRRTMFVRPGPRSPAVTQVVPSRPSASGSGGRPRSRSARSGRGSPSPTATGTVRLR